MKYIRLFEDFQLGDLNVMSPDKIITLFFRECGRKTPNLEVIRVILENGLVDVNSRDNSVRVGGVWVNRTPLHIALGSYNIDINLVKLLIEAGADLEASDGWGKRPLHLAVYYNRVDIVEYLIEMGATVNIYDNDYNSPLDYATSKEMKELLEQHGALE